MFFHLVLFFVGIWFSPAANYILGAGRPFYSGTPENVNTFFLRIFHRGFRLRRGYGGTGAHELTQMIPMQLQKCERTHIPTLARVDFWASGILAHETHERHERTASGCRIKRLKPRTAIFLFSNFASFRVLVGAYPILFLRRRTRDRRSLTYCLEICATCENFHA